MTDTATRYERPSTTAATQKRKAVFVDHQNRELYLEYNGGEHLFRMRFGAMQRLFFFDELFQKLILRNEYGVAMGQLSGEQSNGWVQLDKKRYRFSVSGQTLSLAHPTSGVVLTSAVPGDVLIGLDAHHSQNLMHCLTFAFAWALD